MRSLMIHRFAETHLWEERVKTPMNSKTPPRRKSEELSQLQILTWGLSDLKIGFTKTCFHASGNCLVLMEILIISTVKTSSTSSNVSTATSCPTGSHKMGNNSSNTSKEEPLENKMERLKVDKITTGKTFGADQVLFEQVMMKLNEKGMKKKKHFIVFCPITSRVGSDVEAAMETVERRINNEQQKSDTTQDDKGIILVLMHHTRDPDYSTAGINYCETISDVDLNVHVLFHETMQGLLKCSQNEKAVSEIVDYLRQEPPKNQEEKKTEKESQSQTVTEEVVIDQSKEKSEDNSVGQSPEKSEDNSVGESPEKSGDNSVGESPEKTGDNSVGQSPEKTGDNSVGQSPEKTEDNSVGQSPEKTEDKATDQITHGTEAEAGSIVTNIKTFALT